MSIRPDYYKHSGIEVFDVIEAFSQDMTGIEAFYFGNVMKYICRFKEKNGVEDLKKAMTYLEPLTQLEEIEEELQNETFESFKRAYSEPSGDASPLNEDVAALASSARATLDDMQAKLHRVQELLRGEPHE